jgi:adenylosuccinate synthase
MLETLQIASVSELSLSRRATVLALQFKTMQSAATLDYTFGERIGTTSSGTGQTSHNQVQTYRFGKCCFINQWAKEIALR